MPTLSPETMIAELVIEEPARARVFERLGLDYCCGGGQSLAAACERRALDVETVMSVLAAETAGEGADDVDGLSLAELCDHIAATHHARLRTELPRLSVLWEKVERAHGSEHPEVLDVRGAFELLREELDAHTAEEESLVFPACTALGETGRSEARLAELLPSLEGDHEHAGRLLERLAELTGGYDLDRSLCNTHRAAVDGLRELQAELHVHIHEENNVLFPRVRAALAA